VSTVLADDDRADYPGLASIDDWLHGADTPRTIAAAPRPRDHTEKHVRLGEAVAPGVINPPAGRVRRQANGAQYEAGWHRDELDRPSDPVRELLGAEYFVEEPDLEEPSPAVFTNPHAVVKIGELAKRLGVKVDSVRNYIENGTIPPAPMRLGHNVRAWSAAEADAIVIAARHEHLLSKPRPKISETNFSILCWEARSRAQG
jgi:predicted DNA-binding transcriptional regulator AlpA